MIKAICLHSGGLDSSVALGLAIRDFGKDNVLSLSVDYGQRHKIEMTYAIALCHHVGVKHDVMRIEDMPTSMLTDPTIAIPDATYSDLPTGISPSYVPFRNGQLLSKAVAYAQSLGGQVMVYAGMHAEDAQNWAYPDCTPEFLGPFAACVYVGTYFKVQLKTPLLYLMKAEVVELGAKLSVPFEFTWSCYAGGQLHCGKCPTCYSRKAAFEIADVYDPTKYVSSKRYPHA